MDFKTTVQTKKPKLEQISEGFFGAQLATYPNGYRAVIKTSTNRDERAPERKYFRGINLNTAPLREVAFYELAKILGWEDLVPETVQIPYHLISEKGKPEDVASAQEFVPSIHLRDIDKTVASRSEKERTLAFRKLARKFPSDNWRRIVILDLIANNRDRHNKNVVIAFPGPKAVAIDNSIAFGLTFSRYRNVFHKYLYDRLFNFIPYKRKLSSITRLDLLPLTSYLRPLEVDHVYRRIEFLLEFPYRLPFKTFSKENYGVNEFPDYKEFFQRLAYHSAERPLVLDESKLPDSSFVFKLAA